ncbi:MAG: glycosyltransferase family 2 protein [Selenomonadaceae bacterium]|nr:glycosyltransferase family 2 protein [Selenomonadaceae bacterium]
MNLIKKKGLTGIDKGEIDTFLTEKNFIGLNNSPRSEKITVSLTSYLPRINDVKYTIYSLLNQTFPPDKLILWLDEDSFPQREENLPRDLLELKNFGLTIDWCENLRPYKKLIPALEKYPDDIIVTADDDLFYQPDWLKILYYEHLRNPDCVIAHRAYRIRLNAQKIVYPYDNWQKEILSAKSLYGNFFTSGSGALFKKKFFHDDILRRELFMKLSPLADDLWFWAMTALNGTKIKIPNEPLRDLIYVDLDTQLSGKTLWSENKTQNDIRLRQIMEYYPALLDILIRETAEFKPYVSVVMLIKNQDILIECIENIFRQKFPDFELLLINIGSYVETSPLPANFQFINYPGGSITATLNLGLQKSAGEYILFIDEDTILPKNALEIIAQITDDSKADVIHFAGHKRFDDEKFIFDDSLDFEDDNPILFNESQQNRALLWLQNKLSGRLDTKIFKRAFLAEHEINFDNDLAEFLFQALISAKKYFIVPQAFCSIRNEE